MFLFHLYVPWYFEHITYHTHTRVSLFCIVQEMRFVQSYTGMIRANTQSTGTHSFRHTGALYTDTHVPMCVYNLRMSHCTYPVTYTCFFNTNGVPFKAGGILPEMGKKAAASTWPSLRVAYFLCETKPTWLSQSRGEPLPFLTITTPLLYTHINMHTRMPIYILHFSSTFIFVIMNTP